jgi:hypothetical protein
LKTGELLMIEELLPDDLLRYRRDKLVIWIKELRKNSKETATNPLRSGPPDNT